jgi:hypothetical protein
MNGMAQLERDNVLSGVTVVESTLRRTQYSFLREDTSALV